MSDRRRRGVWRNNNEELDRTEVMSIVCELFVQGHTVKEILDVVKEKFPMIRLKREDVYALVREAAKNCWLTFRPPDHIRWTRSLETRCPSLRSVRVVHTATEQSVARAGAETLMRLVKECARASGRPEVHIGFAGGHATRELARAYSSMKFELKNGLPKKLVIHAMAAGFDPRDPTTDPNTFCAYFPNDPLNEVRFEFLGFSAPALVPPAVIRSLRESRDIREALAAVRDIDIIVASGSWWPHGHGLLRNLMHDIPECMSVLEDEGAVADVLWRPLSARGPIETETAYRAMTLVELSELPGLIAQGKRVLLTLGPCGECSRPKGALLSCLLDQPRHLMTDLVVDSWTVAEMNRLEARPMAS